jgi:beta-galactosidase
MLKVENNKFIIGREEYYPISAEMHYFRVNKRYWSVCFERIKKTGIRIICTSIPWNLHESSLGQFDFFGETDSRKDLVVFLELAREFGFKVILRPGPYIDAEWKLGGYPEFIFDTPELIAKDWEGKNVELVNQMGVKDGFLPSFHHPRFQGHIKRYFAALSEIIKNYIYPKGPVILLQLDNHTSLQENFGVFHGDYNEYVLSNLFPQFLQEKYGTVKKLNEIYHEKIQSFEKILPPHTLKLNKMKDIPKLLDWVEFKEKYVIDYIKSLYELSSSLDLPSLYTTNLLDGKEFSSPLHYFQSDQEKFFVSTNVNWEGDYQKLTRQLRFFCSNVDFSWAIEFLLGRRFASPPEGKKFFPVSPKETKFALITALSSGIKGFNLHMFVERDHWYDSALASDGTILPNYEIIKKFTSIFDKVRLEEVENLAEVGLAFYRPYFRYQSLGIAEPFPYLPHLLEETHKGLSTDFLNLKIDYGIFDLWVEESWSKFDYLFVPIAEFMDRKTQTLLVELLKAGKCLVFFGLLPKYDENMQPCEILAKALKMKTKNSLGVEEVKGLGKEFPSFVFGHITGSKKGIILAKAGEKPIGVSGKLKKGSFFLFSFDISAQLEHLKLFFLEVLLEKAGIEKCVYSSDPHVDLILQRFDKSSILYVINTVSKPTVSFLPSANASQPAKEVIVRLNCKKLGIRGKKVNLVDLLGDEVIKTSSEELKTGILLKLKYLDSRMYLIECK